MEIEFLFPSNAMGRDLLEPSRDRSLILVVVYHCFNSGLILVDITKENARRGVSLPRVWMLVFYKVSYGKKKQYTSLIKVSSIHIQKFI